MKCLALLAVLLIALAKCTIIESDANDEALSLPQQIRKGEESGKVKFIFGKGQCVHSSGQIEHHRNHVHDKSMKVGGLQCIFTVDQCVIPLEIINGLPHMKMRPCTDQEWEKLGIAVSCMSSCR